MRKSPAALTEFDQARAQSSIFIDQIGGFTTRPPPTTCTLGWPEKLLVTGMPPGTLTVLGALLDDASPLDDDDAPLMTLSPRSASTTRSRAATSILRPSGKRTSSVAFRISMTVLTTITSDRIGHCCYCYCYSRLYFVVSRRKPRASLNNPR